MDFQQQMHKHSFDDYGDEDDVFYDELRRQVMQLTAEDDHEDVHENKIPKQGPCNGPCRLPPQPSCYHGWPGIKEGCGDTPAWMVNLWRSGTGTGVFIPQTVQPIRKNRSRRRNERGRTYKRNGSKG